MSVKQKQGMKVTVNRRAFLGGSLAAGAAFMIVPRHVIARSGQVPPSEKMNVGCVGVDGMQGAIDVDSVSSENIYAICDVNEIYLNKRAEKYPQAKKFRDFREMLDKEYKSLDAVMITIPDHMHATVALWAMERGLHVHCQKPLAQSIWECRQLALAAKKYKVATQMGNQGYSHPATRIACETIWNGDLGEIKEVHGMTAGGWARVKEWPPVEKVPRTLDWELWTGRAPMRPYSSRIAPRQWRGYLDYGTMLIGDWGVHVMGPANWGLQLADPLSVECIAVDGINEVTYPHYACRFEFGERTNKHVPGGKMPPVSVYWYEGDMTKLFKAPEGLTPEDVKPYNEVFVGTKGFMGTTGRGEGVRMIPEARMRGFKKPPEVIERSPGHIKDWIRACKGGPEACSNFSIAAPFTEWLLLGTISWRFPNQKLLWDAKNLRFTNNEQANAFVKPFMRKGWEMTQII